jgi:hypothetical protein
MKLLRNISPMDLDASPIWRCHGEADEQATVEPDETVRDDGSGAWIAKTAFTLADGSAFPGYCSPIDDGIDYVQPVLIAGSRHLPLFSETAPWGVDTTAISARLGRASSAVFPIGFVWAVPLPDGSRLRGVITPDGLRRTP